MNPNSSSSSARNGSQDATSPASTSSSSDRVDPQMTASTISHLELPPSSSTSTTSSNNNYLAPPGSSSPSASASGTAVGDDSALDALLLAHQRDASSDSIADNSTQESTAASHSHSHHHHHHLHHAKGTTAQTGAPTTTTSKQGQSETVPTVSSTGMPRFLPRKTSNSSNSTSSEISQQGDENLNGNGNSNSGSPLAPSGSLLLAAFSSNPLPISRRFSLILAAMAVNLGLPFLNGVMLGFGEIFARAILAPMFGLAPSLNQAGTAGGGGGLAPSPSDVGPRRPTGSGVGIGFNASRIGRDKDGSWSRAGTAQLESVGLESKR